MPKAKFDLIYKDLRRKIEAEEYPFQSLLPSEHTMAAFYGCSRNTVRRAVSALAAEGYVQSLHGIGVRVIFQPVEQAVFTMGTIESFQETAARNRLNITTDVIRFTQLTADARISQKYGFPAGCELYYIQRVRRLDGKPLILDINMFRKDVVKELTEEIASGSIYDYLEHTVGVTIVTSKRKFTVEHITEIDEKYLELNDYNCLAVDTSQTFDADGIMFEYTQSRHRPDYFSFHDTAVRRCPART